METNDLLVQVTQNLAWFNRESCPGKTGMAKGDSPPNCQPALSGHSLGVPNDSMTAHLAQND